MKTHGAWFFALVLSCCIGQAADDASPKQVAKGKVEEMNNALIKEDFAKVADLTHPKVVELLGGREKMIAVMESGTKDMKAKGLHFVPPK